jgi:hypothetical protein
MSTPDVFPKLLWLRLVRRCNAIPSYDRRAVIAVLGDTADQYGSNAWRTTKVLAEDLDVSESTVRRGRKDGVTHGFLVVTREAVPGRAAAYRLTIPTEIHQSPVTVNQSSVTGGSAQNEHGYRSPVTGGPVTDDCSTSQWVTTPSGFSSGKEPLPPERRHVAAASHAGRAGEVLD